MKCKILLFFLLVFSTTHVYSMNETDYRGYAKDRISGWMEVIRNNAIEDPIYGGNEDFLKAHGGIDAYFSTTERLFSELVELVANIHINDRNKLIGDKLTEIEIHAGEANRRVSPLLRHNILFTTWGLLDVKNKYERFVDLESEYIKKHVEKYKAMCRDDGPRRTDKEESMSESESADEKDE